jgi:hypothetical protein
MDELVGVVAAAIGAFAGSNVDDLIVLAVLFTAGRTVGRPRIWQIWVGQYLGIGALVAVSVVAALGLTIIPDDRVGLLGLIPLVLGVRVLVQTIRDRGQNEAPKAPEVAGSLVAVSAVTIANGANNIAIYTPMFRDEHRRRDRDRRRLPRHGRGLVCHRPAARRAPPRGRAHRALGPLAHAGRVHRHRRVHPRRGLRTTKAARWAARTPVIGRSGEDL